MMFYKIRTLNKHYTENRLRLQWGNCYSAHSHCDTDTVKSATDHNAEWRINNTDCLLSPSDSTPTDITTVY